jgi:transcriptional regulator GlxA family with amidase domain
MIGLDIVALPGASTASLGITLDVVAAARRLSGAAVFDARVLSTHSPQVRLRDGVSVEARSLTGARARDIVVVLGLGAASPAEIEARIAAPDVALAATWLTRAWQRGAIVASSCTGVFVLGYAGLLAQRRCTTTWWLLPALKALEPSCEVTHDSMVTEHERVWTAGAAFAHIDLMLALAARTGGVALAAEIAKHLVVEQRASQARFVAPSFLAAQDPLASRVEAFVKQRLAREVSLGDMADVVGVGTRTLGRRITAATGLSPMRFVQKIRLDAAIHLLQTTRMAVDTVAREVGFEDASALYRLVLRHTGKPPSAFRAH